MKTLTFYGPILMSTLLGLASGCTPHEDATEPPTPPEASLQPVGSSGSAVEPEPEPETVTVAVASVQLQDDCPKPAADAEPSQPMGEGDVPAGDMPDSLVDRPACVQSTVQLSIVSEDAKTLPFSVRAVRLRKATGGGSIETMQVRAPKIWRDSGYSAWDEAVAPGSTLKVSYVLGAPDWAAVEKVLEESSYGPLYVVELEVEVAGRLQTISSPLAPREAIEEMVT